MFRRNFIKIVLFFPIVLFGFSTHKEEVDIWKVLEEVGDVLFPSSKYFPSASKLGAVKYIKNSMESGYFKKFDRDIIFKGAVTLEKKYGFLAIKDKNSCLERFSSTGEGDFWLDIFMEYLTEGVFCHPIYGGNHDKEAFKSVDFITGTPEPKTRYANGRRV